MDPLHHGSRGFKVQYLQRLLNKAAERDRTLTLLSEDGIFGHLTNTEVHAYQTRHHLPRGSVHESMWRSLGLTLQYEHAHVVLVGQFTNTSCWSAAATEILGDRSVGPGNATLTSTGGLDKSLDNIQVFGIGLGWRMLDHYPNVREFVQLARQSPLWLGIQGHDPGLHHTYGHAVVFSGVYSDGDDSGDGTMFRIHDPWPPGHGRIYGTFADTIAVRNMHGVPLPASDYAILVPR